LRATPKQINRDLGIVSFFYFAVAQTDAASSVAPM